MGTHRLKTVDKDHGGIILGKGESGQGIVRRRRSRGYIDHAILEESFKPGTTRYDKTNPRSVYDVMFHLHYFDSASATSAFEVRIGDAEILAGTRWPIDDNDLAGDIRNDAGIVSVRQLNRPTNWALSIVLIEATMHWLRDQCALDSSAWSDWRSSALCATDLPRLPAAPAVSVGHDALCDKGVAYAGRLAVAGTDLVQICLPDRTNALLMQSRLMSANGAIWLGQSPS